MKSELNQSVSVPFAAACELLNHVDRQWRDSSEVIAEVSTFVGQAHRPVRDALIGLGLVDVRPVRLAFDDGDGVLLRSSELGTKRQRCMIGALVRSEHVPGLTAVDFHLASLLRWLEARTMSSLTPPNWKTWYEEERPRLLATGLDANSTFDQIATRDAAAPEVTMPAPGLPVTPDPVAVVNPLTLTCQELIELTGRKRHGAQRAALNAMGIHVRGTHPDGTLVVLRTGLGDSGTSTKRARSKPKPNLDALVGRRA